MKIKKITDISTHSMSVSDIVIIDDRVYICRSTSWELLQLQLPIDWDKIEKIF